MEQDLQASLMARTFAFSRALDDSRKIQQLDLGLIVVNNAWYACQRGELVSRHLRRCPG